MVMNYLGLSYGTYLGATYANLFPGEVRAMVLDGNVAPTAWTNNNDPHATLTVLQREGSDVAAADTLDAFLTLCGDATTTSNCAFSAGPRPGPTPSSQPCWPGFAPPRSPSHSAERRSPSPTLSS